MRKALLANIQMVAACKSKKLSAKFSVKDKKIIINVIQFTMENVPVKYVQWTILKKLIAGSRKE